MKYTAKNLMAWGSEPVSVDFTTKGLTLIKGINKSSKSKSANGTGKSTILNSLLYARYGVYPEGYSKSQMMNKDAKNNCIIEYTETRHGKVGYIVRCIKGTEQTFNGITVVGDFLLFFIDGKDMRGSTTKDTQEVIAQFLEEDIETFKTAALFSSSDDSLAGKTSSKQEAIFSKILHLEELEVARLRVRDKQKEIKQNIENCTTEVTHIESHIEREQVRLTKVADSKLEWEKNKVRTIANLNTKKETIVNNINDYNDTLDVIEDDVEEAEEVLEDYQDELKELDESKLKSTVSDYKAKLREIDSELGGINAQIRIVKGEIKQAQSMNGVAVCDKCFSKIDESELYNFIEDKNHKQDALVIELEKTNEIRSKALKRLQKAEAELQVVNSTLNNIVSQKAVISRLNSRYESTERSIKSEDNNLQDILRRIEKLEREEPPQNEDSKGIKAEITRLESEITKEEKSKDKLQVELSGCDFWLKGFSSTGIRNLLVKGILPEINNNIIQYADILTNGELQIIFEGEKEVGTGRRASTRNKLEIKAIDRFGSDQYGTMSAGEKRRVDMCVQLAMHQLLSTRAPLDFLLTDEIFLSLDTRGKQRVMALLEYMKETISSIFVISNQDDILTDNFDQIWTVVREGNQSHIQFN